MSGESFRTIIESVTAIVVAWLAWHQSRIKSDVNKIELSINSRMDKLLNTVEESSHAKGVLEEKNRQAKENG